jgi:hypothetical protein
MIVQFLQYLSNNYAEPMVGHPEGWKRLTLFMSKEEVICKILND